MTKVNARNEGFAPDWIGEIPSRWSVEPLGRWFRERKTTVSDTDFPPLSVTMQGIVPQLENVAKTDNTTNRKLVRKGDFAINSRSDRKGSSGVSDLDGSVSVITTVLKPCGLDPRFTHHLLRSRPFQEEFYRWGHGIVDDLWSTKWSDMKSIKIPVPPAVEQRVIADYLDRETAQIDAFIAKNEELIALLTERRAAVITRGVTKGVAEGVAFRPSGVEWVGDVPAHWSVQRLASTVAHSRNGVWGEDPDGGADDIRCVRVADFDRRNQRIQDGSYTVRKVSQSERAGRVLQRGDLLLEKSGGGEKSPVGFVVLYDRDEPAVCSNFVARVQLKEGMEPRFWTYVHGAMYRLRVTEKSLKQSTGIQNLDQAMYFNESVAVPPLDEQRDIADHLESRTAALDTAIGIARQGIQFARERRAALISAAVTGKIDVGVAA